MPGSILNADINFPHFTGQETTDEKLSIVTDYLYMLYEQLRYSMSNLGVENFNDAELKDIITMSAKQIDLTGYVTFSSLSTPGQTIIDGANISTGTISAERLNLTGAITFGDLNSSVQNTINGKTSASQVSTIIDQYMVSSPNIYGGTYYSITGGASFFIEGGGSYANLQYVNEAIGTTVLQIVTESQGHSIYTDAYLQGIHFAQIAGNGGIDFLNVSDIEMTAGGVILLNTGTYGSTLPASGYPGRVFFLI